MRSVLVLLIGMAFLVTLAAEPLFARGGSGVKAGSAGQPGALPQKSGESIKKQDQKKKKDKNQKKIKKQNREQEMNKEAVKEQSRIEAGDGKGEMVRDRVRTENAGEDKQLKTREKTSTGSAAQMKKAEKDGDASEK